MSREHQITRRTFVRSVLGGAALAAVARYRGAAGELPTPAQGDPPMPTRPLGRTGFQVGLFSIGGQGTMELETGHDEAMRIISRALELGVNYIDTAPLYGRGASERYIGEGIRGRRDRVFIATKTDDRTYDGSMRSLEGSLKRLGTDHVDLWQIHNVQSGFDVDFILSREGAVKALEKARDEKMVRFTGITGHKDPFVLKRAIESHPFDAILMAINPADRHADSFIDNLLPVAVSQNMGIMAMKVPSRGKIFRATGVRTMESAMRYALSHPVSTLVIGISDTGELEENARIAREFTPLTAADMASLEELTKPYHADALWYRDHM